MHPKLGFDMMEFTGLRSVGEKSGFKYALLFITVILLGVDFLFTKNKCKYSHEQGFLSPGFQGLQIFICSM